jgi:hypothetical protein
VAGLNATGLTLQFYENAGLSTTIIANKFKRPGRLTGQVSGLAEDLEFPNKRFQTMVQQSSMNRKRDQRSKQI